MCVGVLGGAQSARSADNLVFVPLPPCRVIDTRGAGGGALVAGTPRSFAFRGPATNYQNPTPLPDQGGSTTGCGIPGLTSDASPFQNIAKAVAINIVAVGPSGAGDLRAWAANQTVPNASVINYAAVTGLNIANGVIVPMCDEVSATPCTGGDITFRADVSGTQLVVDVVGYFHAGSQAATLTNTALGHQALPASTTGTMNTATGAAALSNNTTGSRNIALGYQAGGNNTVGVDNIFIGNLGNEVDNGTIRVGKQGTQTKAFVAGIYGNSVTGSFVTVNSNGQLGTGAASAAASSADVPLTLVLRDGTGSFATNSISLDGTLALPSTTASAGSLSLGGDLFLHAVGASNTFLGSRAGNLAMTGYQSVGVGSNALKSNTSGHDDVAVGTDALINNTTGYWNTAIGSFAMSSNTAGSANTALGNGALLENTTGGRNTALGFGALNLNTTGGESTAVGFHALVANTTGPNNTAIGSETLFYNTTGGNNIALGYRAGINLTTGNFNIDIGAVGVAAEGGAIRIGTAGNQSRAFVAGIRGVTPGSDAMPVVIDSTGQLGTPSSGLSSNNTLTLQSSSTIGAWLTLTSTDAGGKNWAAISTGSGNGEGAGKLVIWDASDGVDGLIVDSTGSVKVHGDLSDGNLLNSASVCTDSNGKFITCPSDARLKTNVVTLADEMDVLGSLGELRGVSFEWDSSNPAVRDLGSGRQIGVIAQEVERVMPELVRKRSDGYKTVDYAKLTAYLIEVAKAEERQIRELRDERDATVAALMARMEALERRVGAAVTPARP